MFTFITSFVLCTLIINTSVDSMPTNVHQNQGQLDTVEFFDLAKELVDKELILEYIRDYVGAMLADEDMFPAQLR